MNEEKRIIGLIDKIIPRERKSFESDSEIFTLNGMSMLFTIDGFSKEDMFRESNPGILGANCAIGSISDILASGGIPLYYAHSMVIPSDWDDTFIKEFSRGIAKVLRKADILFLGGDVGISRDKEKSNTWHYTASVIGKAVDKPLLRTGAHAGENLYVTGRIGTGNLEAALTLYSEKCAENKILSRLLQSISNKFVLRIKESRLIKKYARCCIDTSDGLFNVLNEIAEKNNTGYMVKNIPYIKKGILLADMLSLPVTLLFLGECGEYELLFTVAPEDEQSFLSNAKKENLTFFKIGKLTTSTRKILEDKKRKMDLTNLTIRARDFNNTRDYIDMLIQWVNQRTKNDET